MSTGEEGGGNTLPLVYLEGVGLCKVDGDGEYERNEDVKNLGGDVAQRQIADKHLLSLRQLTHLTAVARRPYQLPSSSTTTTTTHLTALYQGNIRQASTRKQVVRTI